MTELQRDTLAYGVVAAASAYLLIWIIPAYTPEYPGYGVPASLLPDIAAGFMLALSLLGLGRAALSWRKAEKSGGDGQTAVRWRHLACFLIPCALLMPAMSLFGFLPAGIAFMVVIQIGCGQRRFQQHAGNGAAEECALVESDEEADGRHWGHIIGKGDAPPCFSCMRSCVSGLASPCPDLLPQRIKTMLDMILAGLSEALQLANLLFVLLGVIASP